eukprot:TRINITY_DN3279_c0_g1_i3.p1 TRINITY_DN3279_c0_g1~~TRINITY_DN3279_c0_g1_i3.p1  ORF type:complete len:135 (-),score=8.30 TRINITY_DN3279_c0_g1_i3:1131-1535(-)
MAKASCTFAGEEGVKGLLTFSQAQEDASTIIEGQISGLRPGRHGLHVHIFGDFSEGLTSAGGIFNPFGKNHGAPDDEERMVGDLGNVEADEEGVCKVCIAHTDNTAVSLSTRYVLRTPIPLPCHCQQGMCSTRR